MNFNFIGVTNKIVNLDAIVLIEDLTEDGGQSVALLTSNAGGQVELTGEDADALFARAEIMLDATSSLLARMQAVEGE